MLNTTSFIMRWSFFILAVVVIADCGYAEISVENTANLPDIDEVSAIKDRCDKKGGTGTYEKLKKAKEETQECIKNLIDVEKIKDEVEEAKKTGSMDEVFGKYCKKRPELFTCVKKTTNVAELCLEENERNALNVTISIVEQIGDFICFRDGDRIAMFIAEGGVECLKSRTEAIKQCVNETLKINTSELDLNSIPNLAITKEKCNDLGKIQTCVVDDLERKCDDTTPANIVDALFKFVKKVGCKTERKQKRSTPNMRELRDQNITQWMEGLKKSCEHNGGLDAFENLEFSLNKTKSCIADRIILLRTPKNEAINAITECSAEPTKALEKCLTSEAAYFATMLKDTAISMLEFAYNHQEIFVANPNNMELLNCLRTLKSFESQKNLRSCLKDFQVYGISSEFRILPKEEMCRDTVKICSCITNLVKSACVADIKINEVIRDFTEAVQKPCK